MHDPKISDQELMRACIGGDHEAFGRIVERYQSLVCAVAYNATGDRALSEDLAQETFLAAWKNLAHLRDWQRLRPWLCAIARNVVHTALRRRKRDAMARTQPLDALAEPPSVHPNPQDQAIGKEQERILWQTLERIPATYREPMILFHREGKSVRAVADSLGLSENSVKQRLLRGRRMLREEVAAFVEDTLSRTGPGAAFTVAVLAALPAGAPQTAAAAGLATVAMKGSASCGAAAAGAATLLSGAVLGPLIGFLGAVFGVTMSVRNARSPRERRFVVMVTCWILVPLVLVFCLAVFLTARYAKSLAAVSSWLLPGLIISEAVGYIAILVFLILWGNRRIRAIRIEDGTWIDPKEMAATSGSRSAARKSFAAISGGIIGSLGGASAWLLAISASTRDWLTFSLTLVACALLIGISLQACWRMPGRCWNVAMVDMVGLAAVYLIAVNTRWEAWRAFDASRGMRFLGGSLTRVGMNLLIIACLVLHLVLFLTIRRNSRAVSGKEGSIEK
jgi:RNA polymerase sigma factor (sigma-70 family)